MFAQTLDIMHVEFVDFEVIERQTDMVEFKARKDITRHGCKFGRLTAEILARPPHYGVMEKQPTNAQ